MPKNNNKISKENSVGYWLWELRTKQGYSLEEVAEYIRIRPAMLRAIEQDAYEQLPGGLYLTGYLRSYGNFLGLDPEYVVQCFREQQGDGKSVPQYFQPQVVQDDAKINNRMVLTICAGLAIVIYVVWSLATGDARSPANSVAAIPPALAEKLKPEIDLDSRKIIMPSSDDDEVIVHQTEQAKTEDKPAESTVEETAKKNETKVKSAKRKQIVYTPSPSVKDLRDQVPQEEPQTNESQQ